MLAQAAPHAQTVPSASNKSAFQSQAATATATAAAHYTGDAALKRHTNSMCVTYVPGGDMRSLCQAAFTQNTSGDNNCAYSQTYLVSVDNQNLPRDGVIKECGTTKDPNEVCVPKGTVALACNPAQIGSINAGGPAGNYQMQPGYIAVPRSTVEYLLNGVTGCSKSHPEEHHDKYAYVKTSLH